MSLKRHGKNNKPNSLVEHPRHGSDFPSREELITQLAQLRSSLDGAYETLESIEPSTDPEVTHKVADMVDIINGLHECEFELMDLLAKDGHVISPTPSRGGDHSVDKGVDEKACDGIATLASITVENDANSQAASQEDLSLYGAYAVSSSRSHRNAKESTKTEKSDPLETVEPGQIATYDRVDYIKRLEEIQKVNEKLVDRCRRLGLVLSRGAAMDKNISSKMKEVKDIVATKEQAQRKILELKALIQQVADEKLDSDISLAKIENDESYGRPFRFDARLTHGASSMSPDVSGTGDEDNIIKKPRSFLGIVDATDSSSGPEYSQFLRGLRQPFNREPEERESAFVPIHHASHLDPTRDKNKCTTNLGGSHGDINNDLKAPRVAGNTSLLRRVIEGGNQFSQNVGQLDQRQARSSSARASLLSTQQAPACNTIPNNLFRSNYSKSPPSMQSSSGMGSMNSRSMASLENGRNDLPYISARNHDPDENIGQRGFSERPNMSSNNLNKSYRQPTRSSSFYSELDFRNQEVFPVSWEEEGIHNHSSPLRSRSPEFRRRMLSTLESQQITDELNRVLRCRNSEETLPIPQQNWWSSSAEIGQAERHSFVPEHQNFASRGKSLLQERSLGDCYSQIMQLHVGLQEITQQIRNLNVTVAANKTVTRDALLQHRFDLHNVTRCIRDVSDMISESMKRMEAQVSSQTRIIMDIESRMRRIEDNQRIANQKYESTREREWQVPGRPDFMVSQDLSFQYGHGSRDAIRERDNSTSGSMLNNQIPPGTRANNYWDNFRSYSRQNMLSKSNANVPQQYSHEASPSSVENSRYTSSDALNNTQPVSVSDAVDSRRNGAGTGKNLWATSGFYENMSSKKRNKDQKAQSSAIPTIGKTGGTVPGNSVAPEPLRTPRDPHPETDAESNSSFGNRMSLLTHLSPMQSPFRRDTLDSETLSRMTGFDLSWPPLGAQANRKKSDTETENRILQPLETANVQDLTHQRENHFEDSNPNSQLNAPKEDREKRIQQFEHRSTDQQSHDDTQTSNQELLNTSGENEAPDWVLNALEIASAAEYHGITFSLNPRRSHLTNSENCRRDDSESNEPPRPRQTSTPNVISPTVPMNIRCEETAISNENSLDRNNSRTTEESSTNNNNTI